MKRRYGSRKGDISQIHFDADNVRKEEERARNAGDTLRFITLFGTSEMSHAIVWMSDTKSSKKSALFFGLLIDMNIRGLDAGETRIFADVSPGMKRDFTIFVIERKFGNKCEFHDQPGTNSTEVRGTCDLSVGGFLNLSKEITSSAKQLFTRVDSYTLHTFNRSTTSNTLKGHVNNPVVKIKYGINLSSWRIILPAVLILLATVSTTIRTISDKGISSEASNDVLRREKEPSSATAMPFSTPAPRFQLFDHVDKLVCN